MSIFERILFFIVIVWIVVYSANLVRTTNAQTTETETRRVGSILTEGLYRYDDGQLSCIVIKARTNTEMFCK